MDGLEALLYATLVTRLAIFGCGGMGRELADIASRNRGGVVFVVDDPQEEFVQDIFVIGPDRLGASDELSLALGSSSTRRTLADRFVGRRFATIIAETARVSATAVLGEGAQICDYAAVNNNAVIGRHFQCNTYAQVSHDCIIGDFVTFSPRVSCNGWVEIGDDVFVGAGAVIRNGSPDRRLHIGKGATIGMGAVVVCDVPAGETWVGNPARKIRPTPPAPE